MTKAEKLKMFKDFCEYAKTLDFLEKDTPLGWRLIGTEFRFMYYDFNREKPELCWGYATPHDNHLSVSFEYVLEHCSPEIQEKLVFHLDLFR